MQQALTHLMSLAQALIYKVQIPPNSGSSYTGLAPVSTQMTINNLSFYEIYIATLLTTIQRDGSQYFMLSFFLLILLQLQY